MAELICRLWSNEVTEGRLREQDVMSTKAIWVQLGSSEIVTRGRMRKGCLGPISLAKVTGCRLKSQEVLWGQLRSYEVKRVQLRSTEVICGHMRSIKITRGQPRSQKGCWGPMRMAKVLGCGSAFILFGSGSSIFSECGSGTRSRSSLTNFEK